MTSTGCFCSCGNVAFEICGRPLFRVLCHCTICQRFNDAPFADVVVYDAASVTDPADDSVRFDTYKPPPNVRRGSCVKCGDATIEKFALPLFPKLTIVPAAVHVAGSSLVDPIAHIFYETRATDADDVLPKHEGLIASQLSFGKYLVSAKMSRKRGGRAP